MTYILNGTGKRKLFVDADGVIFNTIKCICDMYNDDFKYFKKYRYVNWTDIDSWEFTELNCASPDYINMYFNQPRFFRVVETIPGAMETLFLLSKNYDIYIVSHGYPANLRLKETWFRTHMPFIQGFIGVSLKKHKDKSNVNMSGGIFIDDVEDNLMTSNADKKYIFGDIYPWNEKSQYERLYNWTDVWNKLQKEN